MENLKTSKSTLLEKVFYCMGGVGGGSFCWSFISGFITMYYTNSVGMAAAAVGTMMLVARVLDGITDIIFGAIMERFPSRFGKTRHWLLISAPLMAVCVLLCFNTPQGLSESGKIGYMYFTYILISAVAYTIYGAAFGALMSRMSTDKKDIEHISVSYMLCVMVSATVVYILTVTLLENWGGTINNQPAWTKVSIVYAIITFVTILLSFLIKEKVPIKTEDGEIKRTPLKEGVKACLKYKYFWLLAFIFGLFYAASALMGSSSIYYILYVIGDYTKVNITGIPSLVATIVAYALVPLLLKKINKMLLIRLGLILFVVSKLIPLINPTNLTLFVVCSIISQFGLAPCVSLLFTLSVDFIIFVAYKTGLRAEGFAGIGGNLGVKIGTGIGSAMVGWVLAWGQFDGLAPVQGEQAKIAIIMITLTLPAVLILAQFIVTLFWDLDKKLPIVMAEAEEAAKAASGEIEEPAQVDVNGPMVTAMEEKVEEKTEDK